MHLQASIFSHGTLQNYNTLEGFKAADKDLLMKKSAAQVWAAIKSGAAEKDPNLLIGFLLMTYAELKTYKFFYW